MIADLSGRPPAPGLLFGVLVLGAVVLGVVFAAWLFGLVAG